MNYHKLLLKQFQKHLPAAIQQDPAILEFLSTVSDTYVALEKDRALAERAFRISEQEFTEVNNKLEQELELKRLSIEELKETVNTVSGEKKFRKTDDLLSIAKYLSAEVGKRKNAEKTFTSLIDNLQSGILLVDENGQIVFSNQIFCYLFSIQGTADSILGNGFNSLSDSIKDLFQDPDAYQRDITSLMAEKKLVAGDIINMKDGSIFQRDFIPIYSENQFKGIVWSYTDITEKKKSQDQIELLSLAASASNNPVVFFDDRNCIFWANDACEKMFGYSLDELLGSTTDLFVGQETNKQVVQDARASLSRGENYKIELLVYHKDRSTFWISAESSFVETKTGEKIRISNFSNITAEKNARLEIEQLSLAASANKNAVIFYNESREVIYINAAGEKLFGINADEQIGHHTHWMVGPETDKGSLAYIEEVQRKQRDFALELKVYRKNGDPFWARVESTLASFDSGKKSIRIMTIEDYTEERNEREHIERLSLLARANENGVMFTKPNGKIIWANEGFTKMSGFSLEEMVGKTPIELCNGPLTDHDSLKIVVDAFTAGNSFNVEIIYYRKNGSWFWGRSSCQPVRNGKGEIVEYFGIIEDITIEKEQEEKMKVLSQIAEDNINAVVIADKDSRITWVNKSFTKITGYTLEDVKGKVPGHVLQGAGTDKEVVKNLRQRIREGKPFSAELLNYHKLGHSYWIRIVGQPILNAKNEVTGFFSMQEDITREMEREKNFKLVLDKIGDNVWEYDFRKEQTYFSKSNNEFLGYITTDVSHNEKLWWDSIYKEDLHIVADNDRRYRSGEIDSHTAEYRIQNKDGGIKWVLDRGVVTEKDKDGKPLKIMGTHTDITDKKNAERRLDEQRKFYENILNQIPSDVAVLNTDMQYLFLNPHAIRDPELRKWMVGKTDEDYCRLRNKPMSIAKERRMILDAVMSTRKSQEWEEEFISKDGKEQFVLRRMYPVLNGEGEVSLLIGYGLDITERKIFEQELLDSEEKNRVILANMNLGLMEVDVNQHIVYANNTLAEMLGVSMDYIVGYDVSGLLTPEDLDLSKTVQENEGSGNDESYEVKVNIKGKERWWFISATPKFNNAGRFAGSIIVCLDISERKELEQQLIDSRESAEMLANSKKAFLANMSHEIRTPLNAIIGMGNQLSKSELNDSQRFYLNTIHSAADNLLVIINDILDLSKLEAGKLSLETIGFEPRKVISDAIQVLIYKAEEKGISLTNSFCDSRLSPVLIGDPYRVNQILLNLISNSIKFTEKGTVDVTCEVISDSAESQIIQVNVSDTGIGMDEAFVNRMFDKFSQEYESVTRKYGGTGLGMSICKDLVTLMGGDINVTSQKGKGTTIRFNIEFKKGSSKDLPATQTSVFTSDFLKGKTILVTDDNDMNRLVASTILKSYGAHIREAMNGKEAVTAIMNGSTKIDLVLMDIQMPVMDGYEAARTIRGTGNDIPILALTANAIKGENQKCLDAGMNDYITKPFKEEEFLKLVSHWMQIRPQVIALPAAVESDPVPDNALFDLTLLQDISKGNEAFVDKMVGMFMEQCPATVKEIRQAYSAADFPQLRKLAHRLKPSIDNMGISAMKKGIRDIEKLATQNEQTQELEELINSLDNVIQSVTIELAKKNY